MMILQKCPLSQTLPFGLSYRGPPLINLTHSHNPISPNFGYYSPLNLITRSLHNVKLLNFEDLKLRTRIIWSAIEHFPNPHPSLSITMPPLVIMHPLHCLSQKLCVVWHSIGITWYDRISTCHLMLNSTKICIENNVHVNVSSNKRHCRKGKGVETTLQ